MLGASLRMKKTESTTLGHMVTDERCFGTLAALSLLVNKLLSRFYFSFQNNNLYKYLRLIKIIVFLQ